MRGKIKKYKIVSLPQARKDIDEITDYIGLTLGAPMAASNFLSEYNAAVSRLCYFPFAHPVYTAGQPLKKEYRRITVKNYYVFYVVECETVEIHRVIYSRRNISAILG